jgi:hypothetical protein
LEFHVNQDHVELGNRPLPNIRYTNTLRTESAMHHHPNNIAARQSQPVGLLPAPSAASPPQLPARQQDVAPQPAESSSDSEEGGDWDGDVFVISMEGYQAGDYAVIRCESDDEPPREFVEVLKIKKLHHSLSKLEAYAMACTKDVFSQSCFEGKWNLNNSRVVTEIESSVVISYMSAKDFKAGKLSPDAVNAIRKRNMFALT